MTQTRGQQLESLAAAILANISTEEGDTPDDSAPAVAELVGAREVDAVSDAVALIYDFLSEGRMQLAQGIAEGLAAESMNGYL